MVNYEREVIKMTTVKKTATKTATAEKAVTSKKRATKTATKTLLAKTSQLVSFADVEVSKVFYQSENIVRFSVDVIGVTANNNNTHTFITCVWFYPSMFIEEGDIFPYLHGELFNDSYTDKNGNTKYQLCVRVLENIKNEDDGANEIPFN